MHGMRMLFHDTEKLLNEIQYRATAEIFLAQNEHTFISGINYTIVCALLLYPDIVAATKISLFFSKKPLRYLQKIS